MTTTERPLALIAGGSGGIGRAVAQTLARDGWDVSITFRNGEDRAKTACEAVEEHGGTATRHQVDLSDPLDVQRWIKSDTARPANALIYAAGPHIPMNYIGEHEPDTVQEIFTNDTLAFFNVIKFGLPAVKKTRGSVLATVTPVIERHMKRDAMSVAPKAAIDAMIRAIAVEYGRYGVRANAIGVGMLEGEGMWNELIRRGDFTEESLAAGIKEIPLGRWGNVEDISELAAFLLSSRAEWITGQTISVDGGYTA